MKNRYLAKAKDSFKTKLNLYLFEHVIENSKGFSPEDFQNFQVTDDLVLLFTSIYWQQNRDFKIKGKPIDHIYKEMLLIQDQYSELIKSLQQEYMHDRFLS